MSRRKSKDTGPLLSKQFLKDLEQTKPTDLPTLFAKTFDYPDHNQNLQQKCLVEFYVGAYWFGIENGLDLGQIVNLLLLVKKIIDTLSQSQSEYYNALLEEIKNGLEDFGENAAIIVAFVKTYFRIFQHNLLIKYVLQKPQQRQVTAIKKVLQTKNLEILPLSMSKSFEQVKREEKEAEERKRNLDTFPDPKEVDIFDSLSPEEIKQVTLETVIKMVEEYQKKIDIEMGISV